MTKKRKKNKKWVSWLVLFLLLVVASIMCYFVWDAYFRDKTTDAPETEEVETKKNEIKQSDEEEEDNKVVEEIKEEKKVEQYDGDDPNNANSLSGVVTYAGVNGGNLMIRVNIDQYLSSGQCKLSLIRNGTAIYNSTVSIVNSASTATCEGFDVPVSELGGGGVTILINIVSGERNGSIQGEVSI